MFELAYRFKSLLKYLDWILHHFNPSLSYFLNQDLYLSTWIRFCLTLNFYLSLLLDQNLYLSTQTKNLIMY